jgi:sensor domain CHASE-containing protein
MWTLGGMMAALLLALYVISTFVVRKGFSQIETRYARLHVDRVTRAIEKMSDDLDVSVADWATWDDTYQYVQDRNTNYARANLTSESLKSLKIHALLIMDRSGNAVWSGAYDLEKSSDRSTPSDLLRLAATNLSLARFGPERDRIGGLAMLAEGPMIVAARPILTSRKEGPARGVLIMGRRLDAARSGSCPPRSS